MGQLMEERNSFWFVLLGNVKERTWKCILNTNQWVSRNNEYLSKEKYYENINP